MGMKRHMLIDVNLCQLGLEDNLVNHKKIWNTQKRGRPRNKMKRPMSKKTNEPPKRVDHKGSIKFPNPLWLRKTYQIKKGEDLLKRHLA